MSKNMINRSTRLALGLIALVALGATGLEAKAATALGEERATAARLAVTEDIAAVTNEAHEVAASPQDEDWAMNRAAVESYEAAGTVAQLGASASDCAYAIVLAGDDYAQIAVQSPDRWADLEALANPAIYTGSDADINDWQAIADAEEPAHANGDGKAQATPAGDNEAEAGGVKAA